MAKKIFQCKQSINKISTIAILLLFGIIIISCNKKSDFPVANFTFLVTNKEASNEIEIQLINKSINATSYSWSIDGKIISHDEMPAKLISKSPFEKKIITLEVVNKFGQKDSKTSDISAEIRP